MVSGGGSFGCLGRVLGQTRYCSVSDETEFGSDGGFLRSELVAGIRVGDLVRVHCQVAEDSFSNNVLFRRRFVFGVRESHEVPSWKYWYGSAHFNWR